MNKSFFAPLVFLGCVGLTTNAFAQIKFSDYPTSVYKGKRNIVWDRQTQSIKTTVKRMQQEPIDFAGNYVEGGIGCGTSCYNTFWLNVKTGKLVNFDIPLDYYAVCEDGTEASIETRANSRLMIVKGGLNTDVMAGTEQKCVVKYFLENNGKLKEIKP